MLKSYSVKEVATALSLNEETIRRWIRDDKLKAENIGGRVGYRISEDNLRKFILEEKGINSFTKEMAVEMSSKDNLYNSMFGGSNYFDSILKQKFQNNDLNYSNEEQNHQNQMQKLNKEKELEKKATWIRKEIEKLKSELELIESEMRDLRKNQD